MHLRRVLKSSPQDLWLDTLRRTRGPEHDTLVYWMLGQTECDFAIAVHAFYRSDPVLHLDDPKPLPLRPGPSDLFALVLLNWDTGSYRTHRVQVEPLDADPRAIARTKQKLMAHPQGSLPFKIPQRFLEPTGGAPIKVPPHLQPNEVSHLWSIFSELGLQVDANPPGFVRRVARAKALFQRFSAIGRRA
ncbi:hypothetical protein QTO30_14830 [Yoonia sp. GPGPB17]|uniref:hypothetical protein n=1 Tax=Yoonia sp. GPGPB17 TaxID=3026147 RepID=UPI0030BCB6D9